METGMMDCRQAEAALPASLEGSLPAGESVRLREHLTGCPACRRRYDEYQRDQETLARFLRAAPYLPVAGRVLERLPGRRAGRGARSRLATGANALAHTALVAIVIGALALVLRSMVSGGPGRLPMPVAQPPVTTPPTSDPAAAPLTASLDASPRAATPLSPIRSNGGVWRPAGTMHDARSGHTATRLRDGRVLVAGGTPSRHPVLDTAELYDPATSTWTATAPMESGRSQHTATLLPDGQVLIVAGFGMDSKTILATAERYDPATGRWSPAGSMAAGRAGHTATPLPSGEVLVAGGHTYAGGPLATAELYDPATNGWRPTGVMSMPRSYHTATLLPAGQVLVTGGEGGQGEDNLAQRTVERYEPATGRWTRAAAMAEGRRGHAATPLADGQVLVVGGGAGGSRMSGATLTSAERYDPATDRWSSAGAMRTARAGPTAVLTPDGRVLVVGGNGNTRFGAPLDAVERYDPATGDWSPAPSLVSSRAGHTVTVLASGDVLVAGGAEDPNAARGGTPVATAELYTATLPPAQMPQPPRPSIATPRASGRTMQIVRDVVIDPAYNFSRMGNYPERAPRFSPDGRLVALLPPVAGTPFTRLVVYDVASGAERDLTPEPGARYTSVGWSPDGRSLAFVKDRPEGGRPLTSELWRIDADGGNLRKLYTADFLMGAGWSADGQYLDVGGTTFGGDLGPGNNKRVRADGSGVEDRDSTPQIRTLCGIREGAQGAWHPAPGGSYALCSAKTAALLQPPDGVPEGGSSLVLYDYAVRRPVALASLPGDVRIMGAAPDGQWIAFLSMPGSRIWVVRRDGTGLREVGGEPHNLVQQGGVTWSNA
ncbi:MAG: zf-HC2 domain-containing protein, partial [Chloroflexota bacterium]|nr:zf-HC2 domain-containing protein [Chloroflexota bacterium]